VGKYNDGTPATREKFAQRILAGMEAASAATRWTPANAIQWRSTEVKLPLYEGPQRTIAENRARMADPKEAAGNRLELGAMLLAFAARGDRPLAVSSLQIGRVHILDLPGECLVDYQLFAQRSVPGDFVAVAAYTDLGPGYLCTDKAFEEGGYEPTDTAVGPGSEPRLKAAILKLLRAGSTQAVGSDSQAASSVRVAKVNKSAVKKYEKFEIELPSRSTRSRSPLDSHGRWTLLQQLNSMKMVSDVPVKRPSDQFAGAESGIRTLFERAVGGTRGGGPSI
jgi:hypothetical protein